MSPEKPANQDCEPIELLPMQATGEVESTTPISLTPPDDNDVEYLGGIGEVLIVEGNEESWLDGLTEK